MYRQQDQIVADSMRKARTDDGWVVLHDGVESLRIRVGNLDILRRAVRVAPGFQQETGGAAAADESDCLQLHPRKPSLNGPLLPNRLYLFFKEAFYQVFNLSLLRKPDGCTRAGGGALVAQDDAILPMGKLHLTLGPIEFENAVGAQLSTHRSRYVHPDLCWRPGILLAGDTHVITAAHDTSFTLWRASLMFSNALSVVSMSMPIGIQ